jgi:hypothetical protein
MLEGPPYNIALTTNKLGDALLMHRPDCPYARRLAAIGEPVMTLLGCERLPSDIDRHECLREGNGADAAEQPRLFEP